MPQKSIEVTGLDEILDKLKVADAQTNIAVIGQFKVWSQFAVDTSREEIENVSAVDLGELRDGMHYNLSFNPPESVIKPSTFADSYAGDVELGTPPHFVPIGDLVGWADRHGIPAILVQRKIAREGTEPRLFWEATFEKVDKHIGNNIKDLGDEIIRRL